MFNLQVRRHRLFESNFRFRQLPCNHLSQGYVVGVYGHSGAGANRGQERNRGRTNSVEDWRVAMGISWMTGNELAQAIPPAYTKFLGETMRTNPI